MKNLTGDERKAYFICHAVYVDENVPNLPISVASERLGSFARAVQEKSQKPIKKSVKYTSN